MATEEALHSTPSGGQQGSVAITDTLVGSRTDLATVESAVRELLNCYRIALQYASDMPMLGRSHAKDKRLPRWGSRFYTRVYVETHIRKQLQAIRDCLRLELLGVAEAKETKRITALEEELERYVGPLFRWRRLVGLLARLPPVAAALPILSAASVWPLAEDVSASTVLDALLVLAATALVLWILVVWPSIRLGFRVKRVIFAGGRDLHHPLANPDDEVKWEGFPAPRFYEPEKPGGGPNPFPRDNVYHAENEVFRALQRRKPAEVPLDMLLGLAPYLWTAYSAFFVYGLIDTIVEGELGETLSESGFGLLIAALLALVPFFFPLYGKRSYRKRPH